MENAIVRKLNQALARPIVSEEQVVYLLVEIRKLVEIRDDKIAYPILKFCCDWAVHSELDGSEAKKIVGQFDDFQKLTETTSGYSDAGNVTFPESLGAIVNLSAFQTQFGNYLRSYALDSNIADDPEKWANFLSYYAGVIEDCPLKFPKGEFVDEVVPKILQRQSANVGVVIEWSWRSKKTGLPATASPTDGGAGLRAF